MPVEPKQAMLGSTYKDLKHNQKVVSPFSKWLGSTYKDLKLGFDGDW